MEMKADILYEDKDIIVINKPAGVAVQTARICQEDMVSILKNHICREYGISSPYLGVIHRLDQPVSGILVFALNERAAASLSRQLNTDFFSKRYKSLVEGVVDTKDGQLILSDYLIKDKNSISRIVDKDHKGAKKAELRYKALKTDTAGSMTMLDIELITGRFHQIRTQMKGIGHPIVNDVKYGAKRNDHFIGGEICLCACYLSFIHPVSKEKMEFKTECDFDVLIENVL